MARKAFRYSVCFVVGAMIVAGCDRDTPTADELIGYLDRLEFGSEWHLQSEEVAERPCEEITESCPRAVRIYRVDATMFPSSVSILQTAGLNTVALSHDCINDPHKECSALGWDEDAAITMTVASELESDVVVQVKAVEKVGPEPTD